MAYSLLIKTLNFDPLCGKKWTYGQIGGRTLITSYGPEHRESCQLQKGVSVYADSVAMVKEQDTSAMNLHFDTYHK